MVVVVEKNSLAVVTRGPMLAVVGHCRPLLACIARRWPVLLVFGHHWPS